jgi:hypothetical protein
VKGRELLPDLQDSKRDLSSSTQTTATQLRDIVSAIPAVVTGMTALVLGLSIIYNQIYFSTINWKLIFLLSVADHFASAIEWLPSVVFWSSVGMMAAVLFPETRNRSANNNALLFNYDLFFVMGVVLLLYMKTTEIAGCMFVGTAFLLSLTTVLRSRFDIKLTFILVVHTIAFCPCLLSYSERLRPILI